MQQLDIPVAWRLGRGQEHGARGGSWSEHAFGHERSHPGPAVDAMILRESVRPQVVDDKYAVWLDLGHLIAHAFPHHPIQKGAAMVPGCSVSGCLTSSLRHSTQPYRDH